MDKLVRQAGKFGVVGIVCFGIDYGLMVVLTEYMKYNYLASSGISFSVSVVVNYLLSMHFVFIRNKNRSRKMELLIFILLSITGLLLTEILMWLSVDWLGIYYMVSKVAITGIVMVYNFATKKLFLEERVGGTKEI